MNAARANAKEERAPTPQAVFPATARPVSTYRPTAADAPITTNAQQ